MTNTYPAWAEHNADAADVEAARTYLYRGINYESIVRMSGHKLKVHVHIDFYDFQSDATVSRWDGERWQTVVARHGVEVPQYFRNREERVPSDTSTVEDFDVYEHNLLCQAAIVLF